MKPLAALIAALFLTVLAGAQTAPSGTIGGRVKDEAGAPAASVTVHVKRLASEPERTTTTSADGSYQMTGLAAGWYQVAFERTGRPPLSLERVRMAGAPVTFDVVLPPAGNCQCIEAVPESGGAHGRLTGRVTDDVGNALPFAWLAVQSVGQTAPAFQRTDAAGRFALPAIPVGRYSVVATAGGFAESTVDPLVTANGTTEVPIALAVAGDVAGRPNLASVFVPAGDVPLSLETAIGRVVLALPAGAAGPITAVLDAHAFDSGWIRVLPDVTTVRALELTGPPGSGATIRIEQTLSDTVRLVFRDTTLTARIVGGADTLIGVTSGSAGKPGGLPVISFANIAFAMTPSDRSR